MLRQEYTAMSANLVFINIDWKKSRHQNQKALRRNMKILGNTITNVVQEMNPTAICMCEVGTEKIPLTEEEMQQVAHQGIHAWKETRTEEVEIRSMFEVGAPYMTIYKEGPIQCLEPRTLKDLYYAHGETRTAQTFLCRGPDNTTVDVINVHAPSGKRTLTDEQRRKLISKLLQSASKSRPGQAIGSARFLIGGDMNTHPIALSRVLYELVGNEWLQTTWWIHGPAFGMTGDACVVGGFDAEPLTTTAVNHDRQHVPYGICWLEAAEAKARALRKMGSVSAREESASRWAAWRNRSMDKPVGETRWRRGDAMESAHCSSAGDTNMEEPSAVAAAVATELCEDDNIPEMESQNLAADTKNMSWRRTEERKKMIYSIVNEVLGNITLNNPKAEALLDAALTDDSVLPASVQERLDEVFSPIFLYFPKGLKDRSEWQPRNTSEYIAQWYRLASMRIPFLRTTQDTTELNKKQVAGIFKGYIADMKTDLFPHQRNKDEGYYRSCANAKLRKEAGSTFVANAIWAIGMPPLPRCLKDKRERQLSDADLQTVPKAIDTVLKWLDRVATALMVHHTTKDYETAVRKAGHARGETGLTEAEQQTRAAIRRAKRDIRTAKFLAAESETHWVMPGLQWQ